MNRDEIRGKVENLKGRMKEAFGTLTGHKRKEAEGMSERIRGEADEKIAQLKRDIPGDYGSDPRKVDA